MNTEHSQKSLVPRRRVLLIVALVLSLLVLVSATLIISSRPATAHASSSSHNSLVGCCGTLGISLKDQLKKHKKTTSVSVAGTRSCKLPKGAKVQFAEIIVSISQRNGDKITRASTATAVKPQCDGRVRVFREIVESPDGYIPFHKGQAHVSGTFAVEYYLSSSSYYDLYVLDVVDPDVTVTIIG